MPNLQEQVQKEIDSFDKQAVLNELRAAQAKFAEKFPGQKNFFREEVYSKLLDDPARVRAYCQAKVMRENAEKANQIQKDYRMRYLDGKGAQNSAIERAVFLYIDPSGTPEAEKNNKEVMDLYYSPDRGQLQKQILGDAFKINIREMNCSFDTKDIAKTMDYCIEHEKEARLGWVYMDITSANREGYAFDPAYREAIDNTGGLYQSTNIYDSFASVMGTPLAFCTENVEELSNDFESVTLLSALYSSTDRTVPDSMKKGCKEAANLAQQSQETMKYQKFFFDNPEIGVGDNPYAWKAVGDDGKEIKLNDAIMNGKGTFEPRPPKKIPTVENIGNPVKIDINFRKTPPSTKVQPFEKVREQSESVLKYLREDQGKPMKGDPTNVALAEYRRLADIHFQRPKPMRIAFIFRTAAAKAHAAERELMNEYGKLLSERGVSKETLDKIADRDHANEPLTDEDFKKERQNVEKCQKETYGVGLDLPDLSDAKMRPNFVADNAAFGKEVENAVVNDPAIDQQGPEIESPAAQKEKTEIIVDQTPAIGGNGI